MRPRLITAAVAAAFTAALIAPGAAGAQAATQITLLHGIPGVTVDVSVDGSIVFDDFMPGETQDLTSLAGTQLVDLQVLDAGDSSVLIDAGTVTLPADGNHTLVVHLDAGGEPAITSFVNDVEAVDNAGDGRLTVRHTADAPPVNVVVGGAPVMQNLANGQSQSIETPAGTISGGLLTLADGDPVIGLPDIAVGADTNVIVYAVGVASSSTLEFLEQQLSLAAAPAPTTDPNATTTTVDPNASTTTSSTSSTSSTSTTSTSSTTSTTVAAVPAAVNTGSPLDSSSGTTLVLVALGALAVTGGAIVARRRVDA